MAEMTLTLPIEALRAELGERLREGIPLAPYTSARVGGPADVLVEVHSGSEMVKTASLLWAWKLPFLVLGGGSNVLISDDGIREIVLLNRAREVRFDENQDPPVVWAESGANFGAIARQAATRSLGGLEWAAGIPGTLGGAIVGNAGAHGGDISHDLIMAEILHLNRGREDWPVDRFDYGYRSSVLKRRPGEILVLAATLRLSRAPRAAIKEKMDSFLMHRRRTQPPGASMGSMFKNPPGDYAGRLIDAAGLKGKQSGGAQISPLHGNFFINRGEATAADIWNLIALARRTVNEKFGVRLELEIELLGDWMGFSYAG